MDTQNWIARIVHETYRQLAPRAKPLDIRGLVRNVIDAVRHEKLHPGLAYRSDGSVRVLISELIPATNQQTTTQRRRRFRAELEPELAALGWTQRSLHIWVKSGSGPVDVSDAVPG